VTTAVALPADLADLLTAKLAQLTGSQIILQKKVDPEVIGGVSVTIGDKIIDGTVRTQLNLMREHLAKVSMR
jgi:F-type H+-transporting ATPase subunit delta